MTVPPATSRSSACVESSSGAAADESATSDGRRPAARSRSIARFRAIVCSHAASEPAARVERLGPVPQGEECLLHDLLGDPPIRCQPIRRSEDRGAVPVVDDLERRLGPRDHPLDDLGVVGRPRSTVHRAIRPVATIGFASPPAGR